MVNAIKKGNRKLKNNKEGKQTGESPAVEPDLYDCRKGNF
jgi:hypothetical protein